MSRIAPNSELTRPYNTIPYTDRQVPILYSGDPVESGPGDDGYQKPKSNTGDGTATGGNAIGDGDTSTSTFTGPGDGTSTFTASGERAPLLTVSGAMRAYVARESFTHRMTLDDFARSDEVRGAARRAASARERMPDAFVFFDEPRTEVKLLLRTEDGFNTVVHRRLEPGTSTVSQKIPPGTVIPARDLARLLGADRPHGGQPASPARPPSAQDAVVTDQPH